MNYYRKAGNNENTRVIISGLAGLPVTGILKNEFSLAGGNTFETIMDAMTSTGGLVGKASEIQQSVSKVLKVTSGNSAILQSQTKLFWSGSSKPQFTIEMDFLSLGRGLDLSNKTASFGSEFWIYAD